MGIRPQRKDGGGERLPKQIAEIAIEQSMSTLSGQQDELLGVLRLAVSAVDAVGIRTAAPPANCVDLSVHTSDGHETKLIAVEYEVSETDPHIGFITLKSTSWSRSETAPGEYHVALRAGQLRATVPFVVSGPPAALDVECDALPHEVETGALITATATVTDCNGNPVADGTAVEFSTGGSLALERIGAVDAVATTRGIAEAKYVARSEEGAALIIAAARAASGIVWIAGRERSEAESGSASGLRSIQAGFASWQARGSVMASDVFDEIAKHGIVALQLWNDRDGEGFWERYAKVGGKRIPGSVDFEIRPGDVLYLSGGLAHQTS